MKTLAKKVGVSLAALAVLLSATPGIALGQSVKMAPPAPVPDEFFQLSNLTISSISATGSGTTQPGGSTGSGIVKSETAADFRPGPGLQATITATSNAGGCVRFKTNQSTAPLACTHVAIRMYTINVDANTSILDRNKKDISLYDLSVGDKINVYGSMSVETGTMTATIIRDLSKPASNVKVQLEGLLVDSVSVGETKEASLVMANLGPANCFQLSTGVREPFPCPLYELQDSTKGSSDKPAPGFATRQYKIWVPNSATVLDANRKPMSIKNVKAGDTINVYGTAAGTSATEIKAQILRDLSFDAGSGIALGLKAETSAATLKVGESASYAFAASGGKAPYSWSLVKADVQPSVLITRGLPPGMILEAPAVINCFAAPCPEVDTSTVRVTGAPTAAGKYVATIRVTDMTGRAAFATLAITVSDGSTTPSDGKLEVSVSTNRNSYRMDEGIITTVTIKNATRKIQRLTFDGCAPASYRILQQGAPATTSDSCSLAATTMVLKAGQKKSWTFKDDLASKLVTKVAVPTKLELEGTVTGYGSATKAILIRPARLGN